MILALSLLLSTGAPAQDLRAWQGVYEGMLMEAAEGDLQHAVSWYEGLSEGMAEDDPIRPELHYWLGRGRYIQGEAEGARKALRIAATEDSLRPRATALLGQMDALELQVRSLPIEHTFDTGTSHWLHDWRFGDRGTIGVGIPDSGEDSAMIWSTTVADEAQDQIQIGFGDRVLPTHFEISLRAGAFPAWVVLLVEDTQGFGYYYPEPVEINTRDWVLVQTDNRAFLPTDTSAVAGVGREYPRQVRTLILRDVTEFYSSDRGTNTIYVDDVRIR